jgi:hypothetical protein
MYNPFMEVTNEYTELVADLTSLPEPERRIRAFTYVRDIAYGNIGSRNPMDVLSKQMGTCSGKHALLKLLLESFGYEVQTWFEKHDFGVLPLHPWPEALGEFRGKSIPDYHDFLKVKVDGTWRTIDAVFDAPLRSLGFPVQDWDGMNDMRLPMHPEETLPAGNDPEGLKKTLLGQVPAEKLELRKRFLSSLTNWLNEERKAR